MYLLSRIVMIMFLCKAGLVAAPLSKIGLTKVWVPHCMFRYHPALTAGIGVWGTNARGYYSAYCYCCSLPFVSTKKSNYFTCIEHIGWSLKILSSYSQPLYLLLSCPSRWVDRGAGRGDQRLMDRMSFLQLCEDEKIMLVEH